MLAALMQIGCSSSSTTSKEKEWLKIEFGDSWFLLNTFEGVYIQDWRHSAKSVRIPLHFTKEEQLRVLEVADSVDFWSLRDSNFIPKYIKVKPAGVMGTMPRPSPYKIHLKTMAKENSIIQEKDGHFPDPDNAKEIENANSRFNKVMEVILYFLESKEEYKKLPPGPLRM
jgi:hypothetical protein